MKLSRELIHQFRLQGMTFADIGRMFDVSRQRVWNIFSDYYRIYSKTDRYKMYRRHKISHKNGAKPIKPCDYCVNRHSVNEDYQYKASDI